MKFKIIWHQCCVYIGIVLDKQERMKDTMDVHTKNDFQLSPIYEKVLMPGGGGFAGFTVNYGNDVFKNYVRFFTPDNKAEIMAQVLAKHLQYAKNGEEITANE